jgi:hypothetical protein
MIKLTVEQEFNIKAFEVQVKALSQLQAQEMLIYMYRDMLMKESIYKGFLMQSLGVEKP